jgi:hypothetical protein
MEARVHTHPNSSLPPPPTAKETLFRKHTNWWVVDYCGRTVRGTITHITRLLLILMCCPATSDTHKHITGDLDIGHGILMRSSKIQISTAARDPYRIHWNSDIWHWILMRSSEIQMSGMGPLWGPPLRFRYLEWDPDEILWDWEIWHGSLCDPLRFRRLAWDPSEILCVRHPAWNPFKILWDSDMWLGILIRSFEI